MSAAGDDPALLMDRIYRYQRHIYDVTREYYLLGRDRLIRDLDPPPGGAVLEIGCGTARNLIQAARTYPEARFYGLDISAPMLATAHANVARAGLQGRIRLARGDAAGFRPDALFGQNRFDRIFFSYCLSMIPPWREALAHAAKIGAAGSGRISVLDFGSMGDLPAWFGAAMRRWLAQFHVTPRSELAMVIADLASAQGGACRVEPLFRGYATYAQFSR